jgi:hypothetical protein
MTEFDPLLDHAYTSYSAVDCGFLLFWYNIPTNHNSTLKRNTL